MYTSHFDFSSTNLHTKEALDQRPLILVPTYALNKTRNGQKQSQVSTDVHITWQG
jgi:hypothetical protein